MTTCFYRQAHQIIIQTKICNYLETKILPSWLKTSLKKDEWISKNLELAYGQSE